MKDPLFGNKVAAAILTTLLLAIGLPVTIETLTKIVGGHHGHHGDDANPFGLAYIPAEIKLSGAEAGPAEEKKSLAQLLAEASVERGQRQSGICASCHTFTKGGANGIGPNLWNVVGADIAAHAGYSYTGAAQAFPGEWTYENLDRYLANSQAFMPGTQMAQMVRKDDQRANILAYLATLSDAPVPFPAVEVVAEEPAPAE